MTHTVGLIIYPGFELLDATGPASVFDSANIVLGKSGEQPFYEVVMMSPSGGLIASSSGVTIQSQALSSVSTKSFGTLLAVGAEQEHLLLVLADTRLRRWLPRCAKKAGRFGSVCAGTFIPASLGLIDGKRVATYWEASEKLAERFPTVAVDAEALYVRDENVWTSAGVSTGIDMALAMVEQDLGAAMSGQIARRLVLYARRPGYQSQFSPLLRAQIKADNPFADLIDWMNANMDQPLDVPSLAMRAGLSERSFYRKFVAAIGQSPARFVETIRLDAVRVLLAQGLPLASIAAQVGLSPTTRLTEAFERRYGVSPRLFREMHAGRK